MTGRKAGYCTGNARAGWQNPTPRRGNGIKRRGWGFHAFPRDYRTVVPPQTDINRKALESERDVLRGQLDAIEQELSAPEAKDGK